MQPTIVRNSRAKALGLLFVMLGLAGVWWNFVGGDGDFSPELIVFGPFSIFGGLLMIFRPEWAGPWGPDTPRNQKVALGIIMLLTVVACAVEFYFTKD